MSGLADTERRESRRGRGRWILELGRWGATLGIIAVTLVAVDLGEVWDRLAGADVGWLVFGLALSLPVYLIMAMRWWFTARRVGAPLSFREAWREYYASTFINGVMPISVAGDVVRVIRHRRRLVARGMERSLGPALAAAVIDRISGHLSLVLLACATAVAWISRGRGELLPVAGGAALVLVVAVLVAVLLARTRLGGPLRTFRSDAYRALIARGALAVQISLSSALVFLMVTMFYASGRAGGSALDLVTTIQVVPLVLGATLIPLAFGGWGIREAAAAAVFGAVGLDPAAGVAASITFGLLSLVASTPGLVVLLHSSLRRRGDTRQTEYPRTPVPPPAKPSG